MICLLQECNETGCGLTFSGLAPRITHIEMFNLPVALRIKIEYGYFLDDDFSDVGEFLTIV